MPRGSNNPEIITIYWRDIPAQVNAQRGRERQQVVLPEKFDRAIARAKRKAKIVTAHEDVAQWRRVSRPCGEDLAAEAEAEAAALIADFSAERLGKLGFAGGFASDVEAAMSAGSPTDSEDDDEPEGDDAIPMVSNSVSFAADGDSSGAATPVTPDTTPIETITEDSP